MTSTNNIFYHAVAELIQSDQIEKALAGLEAFLDENTDDEFALSLYGSALMRSGDTERALNTFRLAAKTHPDTANNHANLAFIAMKVGDQNQAIESYENAIRIAPDLYPAWIHLGKLYFDAGNFEAALEAVDKASDVDPLEAEFKQMQSAMQVRDFAKAEEIAHSMLAKQAYHPRAVLFLGLLARHAGAHEQRIDTLNQGLKFHPANINLRQALIVALEESGKFELAVQQAKLMVKVKPAYMTYWTLSRACGQAGDWTPKAHKEIY